MALDPNHTAQLDEDAIRVLRKIHERGLRVHWYHLADTYEWGDGGDVSREDERRLTSVLSRTSVKHSSYALLADISLKRKRIEGGIFYDEEVRLYADEGALTIVVIEDKTALNIDAQPRNAIIYDVEGKFIAHTLQEKIINQAAQLSPYYRGNADGVISQVLDVKQDIQAMEYNAWESDWLTQEQVFSSYEGGIENKFHLTPKALELIGAET